jgi:hypothetical protein
VLGAFLRTPGRRSPQGACLTRTCQEARHDTSAISRAGQRRRGTHQTLQCSKLRVQEDGAELVLPAVFKTVCGALLRRPGWVRFPSIPATVVFNSPHSRHASRSDRIGSRTSLDGNGDGNRANGRIAAPFIKRPRELWGVDSPSSQPRFREAPCVHKVEHIRQPRMKACWALWASCPAPAPKESQSTVVVGLCPHRS